MENLKNISIIIPAYNEEAGIQGTLKSLIDNKFHELYEVIIIDDGSTDKTAELVRQYPVRLIQHNVNKGYGAALKTGIRKAQGDIVIIMDSDGQHDPKYVEQLSEMIGNYDMVIGTRSAASFQVKNRQLGKKLIRIVGEYLVEQKLPDYNSGFRAFHKKTIERMLHIMPNGFSFSTTSTLAYLKEGFTIGTFPIDVRAREGRRSNVKFFKDGGKTIMLIIRIIMLFNPLKIFLPVSLLLTSIGAVFGVYGFIMFSRFSNGAILLAFTGILLFFIGLIADQIAILNRKF